MTRTYIAPSLDRDVYTAAMLGFALERAAATLPQSTNAPIFTISGGRVVFFEILGQVTAIIQAQANNTKLTAVPTVGSAVDICAVVDINGLEVGGKLTPSGSLATAMSKTLAGAAPGANLYPGYIVDPGTLNLNCAASSTGQIRWTIFYAPWDVGAWVAAA